MGLFRRARSQEDPDVAEALDDAAVDDATVDDEADVDPLPEAESAAEPDASDVAPDVAAPVRTADGPWDALDPQPDGPYLDLGGLRVPAPQGLQVHLEADQDGRVVLVRVEVAGSELQLAAFAAPRTEGIWDEIRAEIGEQITTDGGTADDLPGPFGRELQATVVVTSPDGRTGRRRVRFLGADGPRWFLRGVVTGPAATEAAAGASVEALFGGCVVVRGEQAMPPRDLLPMRLPDEATPPPTPSAPSFDPLTRGPEITEIR